MSSTPDNAPSDVSGTPPPAIASTPNPVRLLDQLRHRIRYLHYSNSTQRAYVEWARRFILFHDKRYPASMGAGEIETFLSYLANDRDVAASTHQQALSALLFLYKEVLGIDLPWLSSIGHPKKPRRLPTVLTHTEVQRMFAHLRGHARLDGASCVRIGTASDGMSSPADQGRGLERCEVVVRSGKGAKDRVTIVPRALQQELHRCIERSRSLWEQDKRGSSRRRSASRSRSQVSACSANVAVALAVSGADTVARSSDRHRATPSYA